VIIGDSHVRDCAAKLKRYVGSKCSVIGHVKPGAGMKQIVNSGKEEINNLKGDDVIVVWGGSNDISKQNSRGALKHLRKFANIYKDVNVIVMPAPQRYDLMPSSCVNSEVIRFNRLMKKSMKLYTNTTILETDLNRDCFTRHGLHMNSLGKDQIMKNLARVIESTTVSNRGPIIELQWRECGLNMDNLDSSQTQQPDDVKQTLNHEKNEAPKPQINKRQRKNPALKDQDFLWQI